MNTVLHPDIKKYFKSTTVNYDDNLLSSLEIHNLNERYDWYIKSPFFWIIKGILIVLVFFIAFNALAYRISPELTWFDRCIEYDEGSCKLIKLNDGSEAYTVYYVYGDDSKVITDSRKDTAKREGIRYPVSNGIFTYTVIGYILVFCSIMKSFFTNTYPKIVLKKITSPYKKQIIKSNDFVD